MRWREYVFVGCAGLLSLLCLAWVHLVGDPTWVIKHLPTTDGGDGILWQVQTTFLSVGFAGLAIAAQLFAEAPLAIGASRGRVLQFIGADWFVSIGLTANALIALETIWLPSSVGLTVITLTWFVPTVVLLVASTVRLAQLFGHPSRLDEMVRMSLIETLSDRLAVASATYAAAVRDLEGLVASGWSMGAPKAGAVTIRVPVPEGNRIVRAIKPSALRQAIASLTPRATEQESTGASDAAELTPPQIFLDVDPGDRTRLGEAAFRVVTSAEMSEEAKGQVVRLLQSSLVFEPSGSVTPYEETDREIANLKDAIGSSLRTGAFAAAERALELLGHVVRGVWISDAAATAYSRRASITRRDWLFRSIGEVEQDALLSPRVAGIFVSAAMTRAIEAPRMGVTEYVDECLRSFTRLWHEVQQNGGPEFDSVSSRVITCVQNLAAYAYATSDRRDDLQARGVWAMVELVKLALDARKPAAAKRAAAELVGLFEFDREGSGRTHVRGGQLVLAAWLDYLAAKHDLRDPADGDLRQLVTPVGTWSEMLKARGIVEREVAPQSRWQWWEVDATPSVRAQTMELSGFVDRALVKALASAHGRIPEVREQPTASEYGRLVNLLDEGEQDLTPAEQRLKDALAEQIATWDAAENARLAGDSLSTAKIDAMHSALRETLEERPRLADLLPTEAEVPDTVDPSLPILGMNFRVPRQFLVEKIYNQTYADPSDLGRIIGRGFVEGEEHRIVNRLRSMEAEWREPTAAAIRQAIEELGPDAANFVLLTPYGGLADSDDWYSAASQDAVRLVNHIETSMLDDSAILFDRRTTLKSCRAPEAKEGLAPVEDTSIAVGVFEDVDGGEPQVRVETGEYFVTWPGEEPRVIRFSASSSEDDLESEDSPVTSE